MSQTPWKSQSSRARSVLTRGAALALVAAWPFVFYWRASLGLGIFYFGDIARFFYPTRVLYANALSAGRLPLWAPEMLMGFPLLAEMQTGALYPPHLLLYRLLPIDLAINYDILLHLAWLATGIYLFARTRGLSTAGSTIAAFAFAAGGFGAGRITHMSVLAVAAWLPWSLLVYERWRQGHRFGYWLLLVVVFALQFVAGHPQFILLNVMTFTVYVGGAVLGLLDSRREIGAPTNALARNAILDLLPLLTIAFAAGIAAVQLLPTAELAESSARAGGVSEAFFTEFSYNPLYLALLVDPFVLGNPYPRVSVEVVAYLGAMPLLLAGIAVLVRRGRATWFWLGFAAGSFLLALGGLNPLYRELRFVPVLNFFRVPARFLFPMSFALAMLAGSGFDSLRALAPAQKPTAAAKIIALIFAALLMLVLVLVQTLDVEGWVEAWRFLAPIFFAFAFYVLLRAWSGKIGGASLGALAIGATLLDLSAFGAVYAQTFNEVAPRADIFSVPRVLTNLNLAAGARTLTSEWKLPPVPEMRESLYPNLNAAFSVQAAGGYGPLVPRRTQDYLDGLSPPMLDLLGVRYYLIPQDLPVDAKSEAADLYDPFLANPVENKLEFAATEATGLEVDSSLSQSASLPNGYVVANVNVFTGDGRTISTPLRAGMDTAEWAYDRSDVRRTIQHTEPTIATTFPARSAFPIESHPGHTFRADLTISSAPVIVTGIEVQPLIPSGLIYIEKLTLTNGASHSNVGVLAGKGSHTLIYRSEDVAVFENPDYAPRAFLTHTGAVVSDQEALRMLQAPDYSGELLLADGEPMQSDAGEGLDETANISSYQPERVVVEVNARADGYLVLADAWDPGWIALVDGQPTPIHRADLILRAVGVGAGIHHVEFLYRPATLYIGTVISGLSLAVFGIIVCAVWLWYGRSRRPVI